MAKLLSVIVFASFFIHPTQSQRKSDREHDLLIGPVRNVQVSVARLSDASGKVQESKSEFRGSITYDANGFLLEKVVVDRERRVRRLYTHDSNGYRVVVRAGND